VNAFTENGFTDGRARIGNASWCRNEATRGGDMTRFEELLATLLAICVTAAAAAVWWATLTSAF
jgi:hypothetical protein